MPINRRIFLLMTSAFLAGAAKAEDAFPVLENYETVSGGRVGVYVENIRTGQKISWRADERFVMCSTFKASLAACVLTEVDRGRDHLKTLIPFGPDDLGDFWAPVAKASLSKGALTVEQMCEAAVELSDNTCANLLLDRIGGPAALTAYWRSIGDDVTRLDHTEPLLNRSPPGDPHDTTSPRAMATTLRRLVLGDVLSRESRALFVNWLLGCRTGDKRLRAGLPRTWTIGNKTGNNGKDAAGDIGVVWPEPDTPILISVYAQGGAPTEAQHDRLFADFGRRVALSVGNP
jgi:beta-lactamase class A